MNLIDILGFLGGIINPVKDIITNLHTSDAEKMTLTNQMVSIQNTMAAKVLDYETQLLKAQASIVTAEATGQSWLQRNWRPITMLTFLVLVVMDSLNLLQNRLAPQAWTLLQIGLGGYVVGRSAEKIVPALLKKGAD